jgi:hypothetical protein
MIKNFDSHDPERYLMDNLFHFDPATIALVGIGVSAIGTGVSAFGQISAGNAANKVAQRNAEILRRDADIAKQNAEFNAKINEKQTKARRASIRAKQGSGGAVVDEGTNLLALAEQEFIDDLNAQLIRRGGDIQAQGLQDQAVLTSASGTASRSAGFAGAGSSLLTGVGGSAQNVSVLSKQGVFN